jgi:hypothetical protein
MWDMQRFDNSASRVVGVKGAGSYSMGLCMLQARVLKPVYETNGSGFRNARPVMVL